MFTEQFYPHHECAYGGDCVANIFDAKTAQQAWFFANVPVIHAGTTGNNVGVRAFSVPYKDRDALQAKL